MPTTASARDGLSLELRMELFRRMVELRQFEQKVFDLFLMGGLIKGTTHLGLGQEAIAAGFAAAMKPGDYSFCTYRGHNHVLSRGVSMAAVMGELFGRAGGLMAGKGGSMHLTDVEKGVMGSYAIVGAHLPIACGAAWSAQLRGTDQVAVCFFGDGTANIGAFHEALNIAAVWKLPVIFVCENNQYMEYTPIRDMTAVPNPAADRAGAYGLPSILIDGNDVDVVYRTATAAFDRARAGDGPSLVEASTYRHGGHSRADPGKYRPADEIAEWMAKDPIPRCREQLVAQGVAEDVLTSMEREVEAVVEAAVEEAKAMPPPDENTVEQGLWSDGGSAWRS